MAGRKVQKAVNGASARSSRPPSRSDNVPGPGLSGRGGTTAAAGKAKAVAPPNAPAGKGKRKRVVIDEDDEDDEDYEEVDPPESGDDDVDDDEDDDDDDDELDEEEQDEGGVPLGRHRQDAAPAEDGEEDDEEDEEVEGLGEDVSSKQLLVMMARGQREDREARKEQTKVLNALLRTLAQGGSPARPSPPRTDQGPPRQQARRQQQRGGDDDDVGRLPLGGVRRCFGVGFRHTVVGAIRPYMFKHMGINGVLRPITTLEPMIMRAFHLDPGNADEKRDFSSSYRGDISSIQSKTKQEMGDAFVDTLLALEGAPSIVGAGSTTPPNMATHLAVMPMLNSPPAGVAANHPNTKYSSQWHYDQGENFKKPNARKLLETDFWARSRLPPSAQHWNLASLATFLVWTRARLTIKTSTAGNSVYGTLKDGHDAQLEIETVCGWLMDPIACPTTWAPLLAIRLANPMYGTAQPTVV